MMENETTDNNTIRVSNDATATKTVFEKMTEFVETRQPKLYILTPCFGGVCYVNYIRSMLSTLDLFRTHQFPIQFEFCKNDSLVTRARNNLVARAMADPATTHIMFIDNDIMWNPVDLFKMVLADRGVLGGIYPLKKYNWNKLTEPNDGGRGGMMSSLHDRWNHSPALQSYIDMDAMVQSNLLAYNVNYLGTQLNIENNLARVRHVATGFMMLQRTTLETMFRVHPTTKYADDVGFLTAAENEFAYALFDCGVREGHYFSEDWLFCDRWTETGGEVWADVSIGLTHTGTEDYRGSYIASLVFQEPKEVSPPPPPSLLSTPTTKKQVHCFTVTRHRGNPVTIEEVYRDFGENIPMVLQYEGGNMNQTTFMCCVDADVPVKTICARHNYEYGTLYPMEIDEDQYNSSYTIHPTYHKTGVQYELRKTDIVTPGTFALQKN